MSSASHAMALNRWPEVLARNEASMEVISASIGDVLEFLYKDIDVCFLNITIFLTILSSPQYVHYVQLIAILNRFGQFIRVGNFPVEINADVIEHSAIFSK